MKLAHVNDLFILKVYFLNFYWLLHPIAEFVELFGHFKAFLKMNMSYRLDKILFTPCDPLHGCLAAYI